MFSLVVFTLIRSKLHSKFQSVSSNGWDYCSLWIWVGSSTVQVCVTSVSLIEYTSIES
jgi:hypothetical protein